MRPFSLLFLSYFAIYVAAVDTPRQLDNLPTCASWCFTNSTELSSCNGVDEAACVCNEAFREMTRNCISSHCSVLDGLEASRIEANACGRPERSRRTDLYIPLSVEILAWAFLWLHLLSQWGTGDSFAFNDYALLICWVLYTAFVILDQVADHFGFGFDSWTLPTEGITEGLQILFMNEIFYLACLGLTKVSILNFYLRTFDGQGFRYASFAFMSFVVVSTLALIFFHVFQCIPVRYAWEGWTSSDRLGKCLDVDVIAYSIAGVNIAQEVALLILPLPVLCQLDVRARSRVGVVIMFATGVFLLVSSCVRLQYIIPCRGTTNPTWDYVDPLIWRGVELATSVIVACLPAFLALLGHALPESINNILGCSPDGYTKEEAELLGARAKQSQSSENKNAMFEQVPGIQVNDSQMELGLKLGDKIHGHVQTEIFGGQRMSSLSFPWEKAGIRVKTTTTSRVHSERRGGGGLEVPRSRTPSF